MLPFSRCPAYCQSGQFEVIVEKARRVPEAVILEDQALLLYFDNALMRTDG
jgi:hypothetical protein